MSPSYAVSQLELHNQTDMATHTYPSRASLYICTTSHTLLYSFASCKWMTAITLWPTDYTWTLFDLKVDMKSKLALFTFLIDISGLIFNDPLVHVIQKEDNLFVIFNQNEKHFSASEILFPTLIFLVEYHFSLGHVTLQKNCRRPIKMLKECW